MTPYRHQLEAAVRAVAIHSPTSFAWFGKSSPGLSPSVKRALTPLTARSYLLFTLQSQLYLDLYCKGTATSGSDREVDLPAASAAEFVRSLSIANAGHGYWSDGWDVLELRDRQVTVQKDGLRVQARLDECLSSHQEVVPGETLRLPFPKEFLGMSPGFYMALSDRELTKEGMQELVRLYLHLSPSGAVDFMREATARLNAADLAFRLKALNDPARFTRCDAVVLYIRRSDYDLVAAILAGMYPRLRTELKPRTPAFTKMLAPGVGLAEDPEQGESFGLHRCGLLADGLIRAYERGATSFSARIRIVEDLFAEAKIDLDHPYLRPGSRDQYWFEPHAGLAVQAVNPTKTDGAPGLDREACLRTAHEIGLRLSASAVWYDARCNWLGAQPDVHHASHGARRLAYKNLGPYLYSGTSGVALFLAELSRATGDTTLRRTALAAMRHAVAKSDTVPPVASLGLYEGLLGIACGAGRVGRILDDEELVARARQIVRGSRDGIRHKHEFDLMAGSAGAILALLALQEMLADPSLLELAVQLGDELLQEADKTEARYSWKSVAFPKQPSLTGFSHGAAGIGYALLELFSATGVTPYREAAEGAFRYEQHWFDANEGNWPDLRQESGRRGRRKPPYSFATAWCHGAPGIALSRIRAYEILNDDLYRAEAATALRTTSNALQTWLQLDAANYSLCHGLSGNAEALSEGSRIPGRDQTYDVTLAHRVAGAGIERYAANGHAWPCGSGGGQTPNLMLGLAGIGYFYLRLYDKAVPSLIMLQPKSFS